MGKKQWCYWIIKICSTGRQLILSVDKLNSVEDIGKVLFASTPSLLSPDRKIFVIVESLCSEILPLIWYICWKKVFLAQRQFEQ